MKISEMFGISTENIPSLWSTLGESAGMVGRKLTTVDADKTSSKFFNYIGAQDDNIVVPVGTKTLLGANFEALYPETTVKSAKGTDGKEAEYIDSTDRAYQTEFHALKAGHWTSYDLCGTRMKAVYEMTLLSKRYAYDYQNADEQGKQQCIDDYSDIMALYKQFCDSNNIGWGRVLQDVSAELQVEGYNYGESSHKLIQGPNIDWDQNRIIANRAHLLVKGVMPDGMTDELAIKLQGKTTYEKTLDTRVDEDTALPARVALSFSSACVKVAEFVKNSWAGKAIGGILSGFSNAGSKLKTGFAKGFTGEDPEADTQRADTEKTDDRAAMASTIYTESGDTSNFQYDTLN